MNGRNRPNGRRAGLKSSPMRAERRPGLRETWPAGVLAGLESAGNRAGAMRRNGADPRGRKVDRLLRAG